MTDPVKKERPIIFNPEMIRAVLDGRKTQTRRVIKLPDAPNHLGQWEPSTFGGRGVTDDAGQPVDEFPVLWHTRTGRMIMSPWQKGVRLWVREAWRTLVEYNHLKPSALPESAPIEYIATDAPILSGKSRPSIHMPRWASRILLEVTDVRAERVQDITPADAVAEGIKSIECPASPIIEFASLWNSINFDRGYGWDVNPWLWAVTFKLLEVK